MMAGLTAAVGAWSGDLSCDIFVGFVMFLMIWVTTGWGCVVSGWLVGFDDCCCLFRLC
jgi:hypothetical protein